MGKDKKSSPFRRLFRNTEKENVSDKIQEPYQGNRLNPKHLRRSECWDVKYLGCVTGIKDWQTSSNRAEFMELIDEGQANGHLMWTSPNIKSLHISKQWLVITDKSKNVAYVELPMVTVGSFSYAEDENRHFLGIKAAVVSKDGRSQYAFYVLECNNEMTVRSICLSVDEVFRLMLAQKQAQERDESPNPGIRQVMIHRLSASPPGGLPTEQDGSQRVTEWVEEVHRHNSVLAGNEISDDELEHDRSRTNLTDSQLESDDDGVGVISPLNKEHISMALHDGNIQQQKMEDTTGVVVSNRFDFLVTKGKQRASIPLSFKEMNTVQSNNEATKTKNVSKSQSLEIPPGFSNIQIPLSPREKLNLRIEGDKETKIDSNAEGTILIQTVISEKETAIMGEYGRAELIHDSDINEYLRDQAQILPPSVESPSPPIATEEGTPASPPIVTEEGTLASPPIVTEEGTPAASPIVTEEGTPASPPIVTEEGTPASPPIVTEEGTLASPPDEGTPPPPPPLPPFTAPLPSLPLPIEGEIPPPPPPPTARGTAAPLPTGGISTLPTFEEKPTRQPWIELVDLTDEPTDPAQKAYLEQVKTEVGDLEYKKLRQDWLSYQKCTIDVVVFARRIKLILRGDRDFLRKQAKVLLDIEDQPIYLDILEGRTVPTSNPVARPHPPPSGSQNKSDPSSKAKLDFKPVVFEPVEELRKDAAVRPSDIKRWGQFGNTQIEDINEHKERPARKKLGSRLAMFEQQQEENENEDMEENEREVERQRRRRKQESKEDEEQVRKKEKGKRSKKEVEKKADRKEEKGKDKKKDDKKEKRHREKRKDAEKKEQKERKKEKDIKKEKKKPKEIEKKPETKQVVKQNDPLMDILSFGDRVLKPQDSFSNTIDALNEFLESPPNESIDVLSFDDRVLKSQDSFSNTIDALSEFLESSPKGISTDVSSSVHVSRLDSIINKTKELATAKQFEVEEERIPKMKKLSSQRIIHHDVSSPSLLQYEPVTTQYNTTTSNQPLMSSNQLMHQPVLQQVRPVIQQVQPVVQPVIQYFPVQQSIAPQQQPIVHPIAQQQQPIVHPIAQQQQPIVHPIAQQQQPIVHPIAPQQQPIVHPIAQQQQEDIKLFSFPLNQPLPYPLPASNDSKSPISSSEKILPVPPTLPVSEDISTSVSDKIAVSAPSVSVSDKIPLLPVSEDISTSVNDKIPLLPVNEDISTSVSDKIPVSEDISTSFSDKIAVSVPSVSVSDKIPLFPVSKDISTSVSDKIAVSAPSVSVSDKIPLLPVSEDISTSVNDKIPLLPVNEDISTSVSDKIPVSEDISTSFSDKIAVSAPSVSVSDKIPLLPVSEDISTSVNDKIPLLPVNEDISTSVSDKIPLLPVSEDISTSFSDKIAVSAPSVSVSDKIPLFPVNEDISTSVSDKIPLLPVSEDISTSFSDKIAVSVPSVSVSDKIPLFPVSEDISTSVSDKIAVSAPSVSVSDKIPLPPPLPVNDETKPKTPSSVHVTRNNLLDEIRSGRNLKKVEAPKESSRGGILAQEGNELKKISINDENKNFLRQNTFDNLADAVYKRGVQMKRESRDEGAVDHRVSISSWKDDDEDSAYSDEEKERLKKPTAPEPITHSVIEEENESNDEQEIKKDLPLWKKAMLKKRQEEAEREQQKKKEMEEIKENNPIIIGNDGNPLPAWKAAMLAKKQEQEEATEREKQKKLSNYESKFEGIPTWKRKLMEKRANEKAEEKAKEDEQKKELQDKLDTISAMPAWKRELFLEKNPQYRDLLQT